MYNQCILNTYKRVDLVAESGSGCWLLDTKGNKYLDMVAGVAVNSLGHCHPAITDTIKKQAEKLLHVSNIYWTKEQGLLAEKLITLSDHKGVFFCNSGSEAVEGALKAARKYGKTRSRVKQKIICFNNSFHGRTMGSLSVTAQKKYQEQFEPLLGDVITCEFNNIESVKNKTLEDVCAIIVEPIQGEGGVLSSTQEFMESLKTLCIENDILLIFDEVQCGIGRLGTFYAYETFRVIPDIVCMAKGLGGGLPLGAFMVSEKADVLTFGDHGSTFGGNPLVSAVGKSVVDIISESLFLIDVKKKGEYLKTQLNQMKKRYSCIKDVRGTGLMLGIELDKGSKDIIEKAFKENLLIIGAGENIIRIVPPLTISYEEIDIFIQKFEKALC